MTITAKFPSRCSSCGQPITPGQKIEWTKGSPVRHTSCNAQAAVSSSKPARRRLTNGDIYTARNGQPKVFGCSACTHGDRMCRSCQHDEYDM
jgi:hypothetical protein